MPNEEQEQEIEVLQSIYPDELTSESFSSIIHHPSYIYFASLRHMADWRIYIVLTDDVIRIQIPLETPPGFVSAGFSSNNNNDDDDDDESVPRGWTLSLSFSFVRLSF